MARNIIVYTTNQKDRFPPPSALAAAEQPIRSEALSQVLLTLHLSSSTLGLHTPLPGSRVLAQRKGLCFQILGARLLLFHSNSTRLELRIELSIRLL